MSLVGLTFPYRGQDRRRHRLARGLLLSASVFLLLRYALDLEPGIKFDFRFAPLALATLLGGPLYGLLVALPSLAYRVWLGGAGALPGVLFTLLTLLVSALIGRVRNPLRAPASLWPLVASSAVIAGAGNLIYLMVPNGLHLLLLATALLPLKVAALTLSVVLVQARLRLVGSFQNVRSMAYTDKLTGLGNRRSLDEGLLPGHTEPASFLLLLDLDHFKLVNDSRGHDFGDRVLSSTAQAISRSIRPHDSAYRYGGEEFAVLLRQCTPVQARQVAERVRQNVAQQVLRETGQAVTISAGCTPVDGQQAADLLRDADEALYQAKHRGRNRVVWRGAEPLSA
ncbi:sensor domain-containing diguanylate cyclase [Deinococcus sonorensis]|uniref:Diguanylate cyclase n=2 Tax=Deinococcus sonorensis TaxID=309891 RepID=A0AAU7UEG6_9DEIO